jgi:hypothetical protein
VFSLLWPELNVDAVARLVADCVLDANLEQVVGEVVEAVLVKERAAPAERVMRGFAGELEERLAGESVLFERRGGGLHAPSIGRDLLVAGAISSSRPLQPRSEVTGRVNAMSTSATCAAGCRSTVVSDAPPAAGQL